MSRRAQQAAIAQRLRVEGGDGEGLSLTAIAREMGISVSYASALLSDPTGEADRERKRKYLKRCKTCGALTHGEFCAKHAAKGHAKPSKWTREAIIEAIQEWEIIHGRPPTGAEWARARRDGLPEWVPTTRMVYKVFGKNGWNVAIEAAGFTPRPAKPPDWTRAVQTEWTDERRDAQSERLSKLYAEDPDNPQFDGLHHGQELAAMEQEARMRYRERE